MIFPLSSREVSSSHTDIEVERDSFDMLPDLETNFDKDSPSASAAECLSLSSSFVSTDFSTEDSYGQRRPSIVSCSSSTSPDLFITPSAGYTSPTTPMLVDTNIHTIYKQYLKPAAYLGNYQPMVQLQDDDEDLHHYFWINHASMVDMLPFGFPLSTDGSEVLPNYGDHSLHDTEHHGLSAVVANPPLTKSIFGGVGSCNLASAADNEILPWDPSRAHPPSETIEPRVTFQNTLSSSPSHKVEPSTPNHVQIPQSVILSSSPMSLVSPIVLPSQQDIDELPYASMEQVLRFSSPKRHRTNPDRLYRRGYERKRLSGTSSKPKPVESVKSGINCELIIAQNEFACSYAGCIDKTTGKQKRFKRQEHRKRHEKTVHEKSMHTAYKCWVPDCNREFSRTDNLKSHLRNTHSKRPGVRGNRYVATLDKNSEYYDPEWAGELDKQGYPIQ